jgi:hypothetical protein
MTSERSLLRIACTSTAARTYRANDVDQKFCWRSQLPEATETPERHSVITAEVRPKTEKAQNAAVTLARCKRELAERAWRAPTILSVSDERCARGSAPTAQAGKVASHLLLFLKAAHQQKLHRPCSLSARWRDGRLLASGGVDRAVKVWACNSCTRQPGRRFLVADDGFGLRGPGSSFLRNSRCW